MNRLYYGDNLDVLREHIADASVDLIYLDPPFNSNASYNILFKSPAGGGTDASIEAFGDTWEWGPSASSALMDITQSGNHKLHVLMQAMKTAIGENAMMAYLAMMAVRLVELHRVLKPTGSLYLHCDPTASHYLKLVLDALFGADQFRSEIVWKRTTAHSAARRWADVHDIILFYSKSGSFAWTELSIDHVEDQSKRYKRVDSSGRAWTDDNLTGPGLRKGESGLPWRGFDPAEKGSHWKISNKAVVEVTGDADSVKLGTHAKLDLLDSAGLIHWPRSRTNGSLSFPRFKRAISSGMALQDVVTDIFPINSQAKERLGYPTQKPIALLERIIAASSNPGDMVLDPFCGCGTAIDAAQKLGRKWIGIDVTHLAIGLVEKRLVEGYGANLLDRKTAPQAAPPPPAAVSLAQETGGGLAFETIGVPKDKDSALRLAEEKPHDFQNWFCLKVGGYPLDGGRKGADRGVDGHFYPYRNARETDTGVISVKAGRNIGVAMLRDLRGVMEREGYAYGLFLSAYEPTRPMLAEAAAAGMADTEFGRFPRLQILTPADIFHGAGAKLPPLAPINRRAARAETRASHAAGAQGKLV